MWTLLTLAILVFLPTLQVACAADATAPEVHTIPSVALEFGREAALTCGYDSTVYAVYWRYQSGTSPMESLVNLDQHYQMGGRSGPGYEKGRFNITDDYSLIIHDVQVHDEGRYTCEVSDFATGRVFRNHTDVIVHVISEQPFVRIRQCEDEEEGEVENAPCILHAKPDQHIFELSCSVVRVKPEVELFWISSEQWDKKMNTSALKTMERSDGAFDQTLTISINTSQFINQSFTCVAEGLAVSGIANHTIKVFVMEHGKGFSELPDVNTPNVTRIAVLSAVASLVITLILVVILWKAIKTWKDTTSKVRAKKTRKDQQDPQPTPVEDEVERQDAGNQDDETMEVDDKMIKMTEVETFAQTIGCNRSSSRIQKKRSEILEEITRNNPHRKPLYFGVFGDRESGKSALIDSVVYALIGGDHKEILEELPRDRESVWRMSIKRPSKLIALCEIRDMEDVNLKKLKKLLEPISADEGVMDKGDVIHYPILVYDIGKYKTDSSAAGTLKHFSEAVKRFMSEYPILVLKHITPSDIPDRERIIYQLSTNTHIPVDNIFFIGTKKVDDSTDEGEILQLLEMLLKCVKNVTCETATRQTVYRAKSSKQAKESWKRLKSSDAVPSKSPISWKRWKNVLKQTVPSERQMEGEELNKLRDGEEKL